MDAPSDRAGVSAIVARAEADGAVIGVSAAFPTGKRFLHNSSRRFVAASTVKIAIMIELFRQVDAGHLSLDTVYRLRPADKATGSGVVAGLHDGIELTLNDLAYLMMSISDNSSTNILIELVGQERVNATMRDLGMAGSTLGRRMRGSHVDPKEQENWAVPDDYARAIGALIEGSAASAGSCARMLALLEGQQNDRRIARHLPRMNRPRWGSKTGSLPGVANDVGFVITDTGLLIMAVFCENLQDPNEGERIIGDIAGALLGIRG
jgi:beta-lactamase class A